ncbi:MAG TPA: four-carbon acid sugar kinase family protein [Trebonia sp.]|jgi:uncharacterized protein YgbK (DUF1537 family)|nr:four-carbon acid sugar kinase family protein [Trebonia sp.]
MRKRDLAVAIIADDLSGGADCGVAFAHAGLDVAIQLDRRAVAPSWARVAVVPTDSRDEGPGEARTAVAEAVTAVAHCRPALWYKKIDSTLRGHLSLELVATIRGVRPDLSVVASAFPAHGRTMIGGHGFLNGVPLDRTEVWRAQGIAGTADLPAMLRADGLRVRALRLDDIRAGRVAESLAAAAGATDVVVCDAETEDDLEAIAAGGLASGRNVLWAGSAGLAMHLAPLLTASQSTESPGTASQSGDGIGDEGGRRPVVVVVGSAAGAAAGQLRHLESRPGTRVVRVRPAALLAAAVSGAGGAPGADADPADAAEVAAADREIAEALTRGQDVAIGIVPPGSPDELVLDARTSRALSRALGQIVGRHNHMIGGLVLTGGDTAMAVLRACGVSTLRPVGEVVTGVPVSSCPDGRLAVTKAGAFGDDKVLARAVDVLRGGDDRFRDARSMERNHFRVRF